MGKKLIFVSVPGLRPVDVADPAVTPNLCKLSDAGGWAASRPSFPAVTSSVQANMFTGQHPDRHGVIANGFYHRDRREVVFWVAFNDILEAPQLWTSLHANTPPITTALLCGQNIKRAAADYIITPAPIHQPDGTEKPWCYDKPEGLYERMMADLGGFPLHRYWGPMAGLPSSQWIVDAATWLLREEGPDFCHVYIPHLDYAAQKVGPNAKEAAEALREFDGLFGTFVEQVRALPDGENVEWIVAGEYAMTHVDMPLYPNRILREEAFLEVRQDDDGGERIDFQNSSAFAMVDHQFAHVFVQDPGKVRAVADCFQHQNGIDAVLVGEQRCEVHMDHPRSGEIILIARDHAWFAYYYWLADETAPGFARTVDIHRKPGYDPVELFFEPTTKSIPLDATLVKGSHGVPPTRHEHETVVLASDPKLLEGRSDPVSDTELHAMILDAFDRSA